MSTGGAHALGRHRRLADSDDSDDEGGTQARVLTTAKASELCPKPFRLIAHNGGFTTIDDLSDLGQLDFIDLSGNRLKSVSGLEGNKRLKTLKLASNHLTDLTPILRRDSIQVLNVSENPLPSLDWLRYAAFAKNLVLLVATGNRLISLDGVLSLSSIRTLVLSHNEIEDIDSLTKLTSLKKLSLSHNNIRTLPQTLTKLTSLHELRIAHNRLTKLPGPEILGQLKELRILDIGHNKLDSLDSLSSASQLVNVNVRGNPVCDKTQDIFKTIRALRPGIEIIDGTRVAGGRRKLRISRLRAATGFSTEDDRKYTRAPPLPALRKIVEDEAVDTLDEDAKEEARRALKRAQKREDREGISTEKDIDGKNGEENNKMVESNDGVAVGGADLSAAQNDQVDRRESTGDDPDKSGKKRNREPESGDINRADVREKIADDDDDDEINADEFLEQARRRHSSGTTERAKVKELSRNKKRKKGEKRRRKEVVSSRGAKVNQSFGFGGDSQW